MSHRFDGNNSDKNPPKRTIPELLRSVSQKFRNEIHKQEKEKTTPPEMRTKDVERFED